MSKITVGTVETATGVPVEFPGGVNLPGGAGVGVDDLAAADGVLLVGNAADKRVMSASSGTSVIGYAADVDYAVIRNAEGKLQESVSVLDFPGVDPTGATDSTDGINAAIAYGISLGLIGKYFQLVFPFGTYLVDKIIINNPFITFSIRMDGCQIVGNATSGSVRNGVIDLVDAHGFNLLGSHTINASNSAIYQGAMSIRASSTGYGLQRVNIYNQHIVASNFGIWIGSATDDKAISEINFFGSDFTGVPVPVFLGGSNSGAQFQGCNIVSEPNAAFPSSPQHSIWMAGGFIKIVGGESLTNPLGTSTFNLTPSNGSAKSYPQLSISSSHIETNCGVLATIQAAGVSSPSSAASNLSIVACSGYCGEWPAKDFISCVDSSYSGNVSVKDCNFYAAASRTAYNIATSSPTTKISTDSISWGNNFKEWKSGVSGGILKHSMQPALDAWRTAQDIGIGASAVILFQVVNAVDPFVKYSAGYNASTGVFTVPGGGFKQLNINVILEIQYQPTLEWGIRKNGVMAIYGTGNNKCSAFGSVFNLVAGDTIDVYVSVVSGSATGAHTDINNNCRFQLSCQTE